ncbi:MAG: DUF6671 family protein [Actinomycetota bacterium]
MNPPQLWHNRTAVLATMHQKERAIAPILEAELGIKIRVPPDFNTDIFGTFTREVKRLGTQIEAARLKAEKAIELTGETLALASEGTFGPHPAIPYLPSNREIVLLLDRANHLEIIGESFSTETNYSHQLVSSLDEANDFAKTVGFPEHALVIIFGDKAESQCEIIKGITTEKQLTEAVRKGLKQSLTGKIHIETDMRAMYNPTRMKNIANATLNLIQKINQLCPDCTWPGFDVVERKRGLPCGLCSFPTPLTRSLLYQCKKCGFSQEELFPDGKATADPSLCEYCNP